MSSVLSLPPRFSNGNFNKGEVVVGPLGDGHDVPLGEGLSVVVCGGEDDLEVLCGLLVLTSISLRTPLTESSEIGGVRLKLPVEVKRPSVPQDVLEDMLLFCSSTLNSSDSCHSVGGALTPR